MKQPAPIIVLAALALSVTPCLAQDAEKQLQKHVNTTSDQARILTSKDIGAMDEASLEYFIAHAGRLLKGDKEKQIALMNERLQRLKADRKRKLVLDGIQTNSTSLTPKPKPTPIGSP